MEIWKWREAEKNVIDADMGRRELAYKEAPRSGTQVKSTAKFFKRIVFACQLSLTFGIESFFNGKHNHKGCREASGVHRPASLPGVVRQCRPANRESG